MSEHMAEVKDCSECCFSPLTLLSSPLTFLSSLLFSPVDVVLELDADLPLVGLVSDEGVLHQLLRGWSLAVVLH